MNTIVLLDQILVMQKLPEIAPFSLSAIVQNLDFLVTSNISGHPFVPLERLPSRKMIGTFGLIVFDDENVVDVLVDYKVVHVEILV